jgi:predicted GNAT family N-acyltransferase
MDKFTYKYITHNEQEFKEAAELRFSILFKPYNVIKKYDYDELDAISLHLAVLSKGQVIAYSRMTVANGEGKITNVAVSSEYLNKRIGFEMMKRHISKANELKLKKLSLNARVDTVGFYEKVGFKCRGAVWISEKSGLNLQKMCIKLYVD